MSAEILKRIYIESCHEELKAFKPGNHSSISKILGMSELKFKQAAKISSKYLTNKKLSFGETIFYSSKKCRISLNSNYNLGIIILCAPLIRVCLSNSKNFKANLEKLLNSISPNDGSYILKSIAFVKPAGIKNYTGKGNIFDKNKILSFSEIMHIGAKWDRISRCYVENYREIFDFGLPLFSSLKKKISRKKAIEILYINYLSKSLDSNILRKFGSEKASIVMKGGIKVRKKMNIYRKNHKILENFDFYLKKLHFNPGTCADLTVTTLLMDKIRDIFRVPL